MSKTYKLAFSGLLIAIGFSLGSLFFIPIGPIKAYPIQHAITIISSILLGPFYAVSNAFMISLLRNLMGTGTILAFPGSMIGAFFASMLYKKYQRKIVACLGELLGTGILGSAIATYLATVLLGSTKGWGFFFIAFATSSLVGTAFGVLISHGLNGVLLKGRLSHENRS